MWETDLEAEEINIDNSRQEAREEFSELNLGTEHVESKADGGEVGLETRLTYDEPGKSNDRPLTIVHRGLVIKIGRH